MFTRDYIGLEMVRIKDARVKQVMVGIAFFGCLIPTIVGLLVGWRQVPGLLGEWLGIVVGIMSTPFFLEATFIILGAVTVISLNTWRQYKEGDEFVYLDQVTGPDLPADLPDSARWALYSKEPLTGEFPSLLEQVEGAISIGDHGAAANFLAAMSPEELAKPETLRLRIDLAQACNHLQLAQRLEEDLVKITGGDLKRQP